MLVEVVFQPCLVSLPLIDLMKAFRSAFQIFVQPGMDLDLRVA